jgi:hypothetical protein
MGREPEADRLQIARHANQRDAFALAWARGEVVSKERLAKLRRHLADDDRGRRDLDLGNQGLRDPDIEYQGRRDRDRIRPEERHPSGTVGELERVPDPAPALVAALREYLQLSPRLVEEGPSWLANTLWAHELVEGKPAVGDVEAALADIECENSVMQKQAKGA